MRIAAATATALAIALLLGGCGGASSGGGARPREPGSGMIGAPPGASVRSCPGGLPRGYAMHATGVSCRAAAAVAAGWSRQRGCRPGAASRAGCRVGAYRCLAAAAARGYSVSCARHGRSVGFTVPRGRSGAP